MDVKIESSWKKKLEGEFQKSYFQKLALFLKDEYQKNKIYPPGSLIFNAFEKCPWNELKVVIVGQDPYHGEKQAHGLCFSVQEGIKIPPSLVNIFKEIQSDIGISPPNSGDLTRWATQGVLLLNDTLTVRESQAGSHQAKGWETFTDAVLQIIATSKKNIVFLLWGNYAQSKGAFIDPSNHLILKASHPSPFSAANSFFGCKHFSKTNNFLEKMSINKIIW